MWYMDISTPSRQNDAATLSTVSELRRRLRKAFFTTSGQ